jgi:hypothetical protein
VSNKAVGNELILPRRSIGLRESAAMNALPSSRDRRWRDRSWRELKRLWQNSIRTIADNAASA